MAISARPTARAKTTTADDLPEVAKDTDTAFYNSLQRGMDTTQASLYAFAGGAGRLTGVDAIKEWGEEGAQRNLYEAAMNPAEIESIDDVDSLSKLGTYILEAVGENIPNLALMAGGGVVGAGVRAGMAKAALANISKRAALTAGAAAGNYPLQYGETYIGLTQAGVDPDTAAKASVVPAAAKTALDVFGIERIVTYAFKGLERQAGKELIAQFVKQYKDRGLLKALGPAAQRVAVGTAKAGGVGFSVEAPTEGMQAFIDVLARAYHDPTFDPFGPEAQAEIKESFFRGGAAGGGTSIALTGGTSTVSAAGEIFRQRAPIKEEVEGTPPPKEEITPPPEEGPPAEAEPAPVPEEVEPTPEPAPIVEEEIPADEPSPEEYETVMSQALREAGVTPETPLGVGPEAEEQRVAFGTLEEGELERDGADVRVAEDLGTAEVEMPTATPDDPNNTTPARNILRLLKTLFPSIEGLTITDASGHSVDADNITDPEVFRAIGKVFLPDDKQSRADRKGPYKVKFRSTAQPDVIGDFDQRPQVMARLALALTRSTRIKEAATLKVRHEGLPNMQDPAKGPAQMRLDPGQLSFLGNDLLYVERRGKEPPAGSRKLYENILAAVSFLKDRGFTFDNVAEGQVLPPNLEVQKGLTWKQLVDKYNRSLKRGPSVAVAQTEAVENLVKDPNSFEDLEAADLADHGTLKQAGLSVNDVGADAFDNTDRTELLEAYQQAKLAQLRTLAKGTIDGIADFGDFVEHVEAGKDPADFDAGLIPALQDVNTALFGYDAQIQDAETRGDEDAITRLEERQSNYLSNQIHQVTNKLEKFSRFDPGEMLAQLEGEAVKEATEEAQKRVAQVDAEAAVVKRTARVAEKVVKKKKPKPKAKYDKVVTVVRKEAQQLVDDAKAVLKVMGMGDVLFSIVDESGIEALKKDPRYANDVSILEDRAKNPEINHARIMFPQGDTIASRVPLIYVPSTIGRKKAAIQLAHELGHLISATHLIGAPAETKKALMEALGGRGTSFEENFANAFVDYLVKRRAPKNVIEKYFKSLIDALRKFWRQFYERQEGVNETFAQFMDALVDVQRARKQMKVIERAKPRDAQGRSFVTQLESAGKYVVPPSNFAQEALDFSIVEKAKTTLEKRIGAKKAKALLNYADKKTSLVREMGHMMWETFIQSEDARLRAMDVPELNDKFTNKFNHRPGTVSKVKGGTWFQRQEREAAPFLNRFTGTLQQYLPQSTTWIERKLGIDGPKEESNVEKMKVIRELYHAKLDETGLSKGATEIRAWLKDLHTYLVDADVKPDFKPTEMPIMWDTQSLVNDSDNVVAKLKELGLDQEQAMNVYRIFVNHRDGDVMFARNMDVTATYIKPMNIERSNHVPQAVVNALEEHLVTDVGAVLLQHMSQVARKGVQQKMLGYNLEEQGDNEVRKRFGQGMAVLRGFGFVDSIDVQEGLTGRILKIDSPTAKMYIDLAHLFRDGKINHDQLRFILDKTVPAYLGTRYREIRPAFRRLNSLLVTWQNWAKLSLALLASLMDLGVVTWHAGQPLKGQLKVIRALLSKEFRAELKLDAHSLGAIRDDIIAHILADVGAMDTHMSRGFTKANNLLFKVNMLHSFTNLARAISLSFGKEAIIRAAEAGDNAALKLLGTNVREVQEWMRAEQPLEAGTGHDNVQAALFQWVDQSVVRPTAALRPDWANNPRFTVFWHLKGWMWGYTETVLRHAFEQTKSAQGLQKILPFAMLAAVSLAFGMIGYELRGLITHRPEQFEREGLEYGWELVQRSGVLGMFQLYVDMEESREYGRLALLAPLGPTASTVEDFFRKDIGYSAERALPLGNLLPGIRRWMAETD